MGYSVDDYMKLQQMQQSQNENLNQLRLRSGVDTTVITPGKVTEGNKYNVAAFKWRGVADTLNAFGYNIFNYSPTTFRYRRVM